MATIINTPGGQPDTGNSATIWVVGLIIIVLIGLFAFFVWPGMNNQAAPTNTTIVEPTPQQPQPSNVYNTTVNATTTVNNSTTTNP